MSVNDRMRARRREQRSSLLGTFLSLLLVAAIFIPAVILLLRDEPFLIVVDGGEQAKAERQAAPVRQVPQERPAPQQPIRRATPTAVTQDRRLPATPEPAASNYGPLERKRVEPPKPAEPALEAFIELDFEKRRMITFVEDLFPQLTPSQISMAQFTVEELVNAEDIYRVQPDDSLEATRIIFPQASRVSIVADLTERRRDGEKRPAIEVQGRIRALDDKDVLLNFDAVQRERKAWLDYAKARNHRRPAGMQLMVLGMMSTDALGVYNVNGNNQRAEYAQRRAAEDAAAKAYANRVRVSREALVALDSLDAMLVRLHGRAQLRITYLRPNLSNVSTTPHALR